MFQETIHNWIHASALYIRFRNTLPIDLIVLNQRKSFKNNMSTGVKWKIHTMSFKTYGNLKKTNNHADGI